jgi:hypothetical protein
MMVVALCAIRAAHPPPCGLGTFGVFDARPQ